MKLRRPGTDGAEATVAWASFIFFDAGLSPVLTGRVAVLVIMAGVSSQSTRFVSGGGALLDQADGAADAVQQQQADQREHVHLQHVADDRQGEALEAAADRQAGAKQRRFVDDE